MAVHESKISRRRRDGSPNRRTSTVNCAMARWSPRIGLGSKVFLRCATSHINCSECRLHYAEGAGYGCGSLMVIVLVYAEEASYQLGRSASDRVTHLREFADTFDTVEALRARVSAFGRRRTANSRTHAIARCFPATVRHCGRVVYCSAVDVHHLTSIRVSKRRQVHGTLPVGNSLPNRFHGQWRSRGPRAE